MYVVLKLLKCGKLWWQTVDNKMYLYYE